MISHSSGPSHSTDTGSRWATMFSRRGGVTPSVAVSASTHALSLASARTLNMVAGCHGRTLVEPTISGAA